MAMDSSNDRSSRLRATAALALAGAAALLGGCAATYQAPQGAATATVVVKRGESPSTLSHTLHSRIYSDEACKQGLGTLGSVGALSPDAKSTPVAAGTRVFVRTYSAGSHFGSNTNRRCVNLVSFVPQAGATYELTQDFNDAGCRIHGADVSRTTPPPMFQSHRPLGACAP